MIHLQAKSVHYLLNNKIEKKPIEPYSDIVLDFLDTFSKELQKEPLAKEYSDILTFAFWCRKANMKRLKSNYTERDRLGWGVTFHIAPSNVPINFIISYVYGLLSGNSNIVRISSKPFPQVDIISLVLKRLFKDSKYIQIKNMSCFISYERDDTITNYFSNLANSRIIWGGDQTIQSIKKLKTNPKLIDVVFADRYSLSIMDSKKILSLNEEELYNLSKKFYNDTYLMDQQGCSSPHLIIWTNHSPNGIDKFFNTLQSVVKENYDFQNIMAIDKYTQLCLDSVNLQNIIFKKYNNFIYTVTLKSLDTNVSQLRGKSGYFYQYFSDDLNILSKIVDDRFQTITYFGVDKHNLKNIIFQNSLLGIDRIVPVGMAFEIDIFWDGYDIVSTLSRKISII